MTGADSAAGARRVWIPFLRPLSRSPDIASGASLKAQWRDEKKTLCPLAIRRETSTHREPSRPREDRFGRLGMRRRFWRLTRRC